MLKGPSSDSLHQAFKGVACAVTAFLIWGLSPVYWKALKAVPAFEILMHRMIWSFVFLMPLVISQGQWSEFVGALKNRRILGILTVTTLIVGANWFLFIWAINSDHILQTSLGYYINPLINVVLGLVFLKERLRPLQIFAVLLAGLGVTYLTIQFGEPPWVALAIAFTFAFYALIRKVAPVSSLVGLSIETMLLSLPALGYLVYLDVNGQGSFLRLAWTLDLLMVGAALVTAFPLLLFTVGARRLNLATVGLLQYLAPSCTFMLAVFYYHEPFIKAQLWTFVMIWTALIIYSYDSIRQYLR
jgi:chloramphenicol-sensitive protein RarD